MEIETSPPPPPRRADTPCPSASLDLHCQPNRHQIQMVNSSVVSGQGQFRRRGTHGSSGGSGSGSATAAFVLLPDGGGGSGCGMANRRFIELAAGTTVVGRCKSSGIRDHHVSRRHVEVTVPEEGQEGSKEGYCRIKYIGRNCRVVLVGGVLLKAEQEVTALPGTKVILNFNNKGLPRYSYTLLPANHLSALSASMAGVRAAAGTAGRWRGSGPQQCAINKRPARFRKEAQDKLQKEREEIFSRFADLKFA
ncbi:unnamed protein product [Sphacelaria rigidula]